MRVVIVYESLFGNTRQVAEAIAEGVLAVAPEARVTCVRATEGNRDVAQGADLLAVGGPTHVCGLSSGFSRKLGLKAAQVAAAREAGHPLEPGAAGPGIRDWFMALPKATAGSLGAAFDTRTESLTADPAADGIAGRLRRHGYELVAEPEGFIVEAAQGPLRRGDRDRARAWGERLIRAASELSRPEPPAGQQANAGQQAHADGRPHADGRANGARPSGNGARPTARDALLPR